MRQIFQRCNYEKPFFPIFHHSHECYCWSVFFSSLLVYSLVIIQFIVKLKTQHNSIPTHKHIYYGFFFLDCYLLLHFVCSFQLFLSLSLFLYVCCTLSLYYRQFSCVCFLGARFFIVIGWLLLLPQFVSSGWTSFH